MYGGSSPIYKCRLLTENGANSLDLRCVLHLWCWVRQIKIIEMFLVLGATDVPLPCPPLVLGATDVSDPGFVNQNVYRPFHS